MNTMMVIGQLLKQKNREVLTIAPTATVFEAIQLMDGKGVGSLLVLNSKGNIAGIFTERDCFRKVILKEKNPTEVQVRTVMTRKVIYASPEDTVESCMSLMTEKRIRHLPVIDSREKLAGIISIGDLVKYMASQRDVMIRNLEKYIEGSL